MTIFQHLDYTDIPGSPEARGVSDRYRDIIVEQKRLSRHPITD